eukprot:TRINITY_DN11598_c0_g1_i6.p1 TRINITY_DN11598_c0_g1~~TRINITY_DN11598_c0_g1_i6.p1  ORF type:complete len:280 (+),score=46.89 TRINITY_DN11598_c0_g1_i6:129-968(+)
MAKQRRIDSWPLVAKAALLSSVLAAIAVVSTWQSLQEESFQRVGGGEVAGELQPEEASALFEHLKRRAAILGSAIERTEALMPNLRGDNTNAGGLLGELGRVRQSLAVAKSELQSQRAFAEGPRLKEKATEASSPAPTKASSPAPAPAKQPADTQQHQEDQVETCDEATSGCSALQTRDECLRHVDGRDLVEDRGLRVKGEPCIWCGGLKCFEQDTKYEPTLCEPMHWLLAGEGIVFKQISARRDYTVCRCSYGALLRHGWPLTTQKTAAGRFFGNIIA